MSAKKLTLRKYGFGIVDRNGHPYWSEDCVCNDRGTLEDVCREMNDPYNALPEDLRRPYRVVRLYWRGKA